MEQNDNRSDGAGVPQTPVARSLAVGHGWSVAEYVCCAGPGDRAFEERHEAFAIAAVLDGTFRYRTDTGTSLLHPGAFLLGNFGSCFECGHDHSSGDRCLAFHFSPAFFAEVAASAAGSARFKFRSGMAPLFPTSIPWLARTHSIIALRNDIEIEEAVTALMEVVLGTMSGAVVSAQRLSAKDEQRISEALHSLERDYSEPLVLDQLAARAMMSKYHFLRSFRRVVGSTPYQYLLALRLRHSAERLLQSSEPVSAIAFEAGFGDLSTFNARFRRQFGTTPSVFRSEATHYGKP